MRGVLLVSIDTLRADHLGVYGYHRATSPRIDDLARRSLVFDRAFAASSWTLPSLATLQTGLPPQAHLCNDNDSALDPSVTTLAERLRETGVATMAVANHVFMHRRHRLDQGFDVYDDTLVARNFRRSHEAVTSEDVTDRALALIRAHQSGNRGGRWFLWAHYFDPHHVYHRHEGFDFGSEEIDLYDSEIAFTDYHVGRLLDGLEELGIADETAVILCADHGEAFGEHNSRRHRQDLFVETARVPLLVCAPGLAPGRVARPVSIADIPATVLDLFGLPQGALERSTFSRSLLAPAGQGPPPLLELTSRFVPAWEAIAEGPWELVVERGSGRSHLFDASSDPRQERDLAAERPERVRAMMESLELWTSRARALATGGARARLGAEETEALRQLGYVEGGR